MAYPFSMTFTDARGFMATLHLWVDEVTLADAVTSANAIAPLIFSLSNADMQHAGGCLLLNPSQLQYGGTDDFQACWIKAQIVLTDLNGGLHRIEIPSPKTNIFLSDLETLDVLNGDVTALFTALHTYHACGPNGLVFSELVGGKRIHRRTHRKINNTILSPTLTQGLA